MELYFPKITEKSSAITKVKKVKVHGKFVSFKIKNFNNAANKHCWSKHLSFRKEFFTFYSITSCFLKIIYLFYHILKFYKK